MKQVNFTIILITFFTFFGSAQTTPAMEVVSPVILFTVDTVHHQQLSYNAFLFRTANGVHKLCTTAYNVADEPEDFIPCKFYYLAVKDYTVPTTIKISDTSKYYKSGTLYVNWNFNTVNGKPQGLAIGTILNEKAIRKGVPAFGYITKTPTQDTLGVVITLRMSDSDAEIEFKRYVVKKCEQPDDSKEETYYGTVYEPFINNTGGGGIILSSKYKEFLGVLGGTLLEVAYTPKMKMKYKTVLIAPNQHAFLEMLQPTTPKGKVP